MLQGSWLAEWAARHACICFSTVAQADLQLVDIALDVLDLPQQPGQGPRHISLHITRHLQASRECCSGWPAGKPTEGSSPTQLCKEVAFCARAPQQATC